MTIEIKVSKEHEQWLGNPILFSIDVLKRMKEAGIPVVGAAVLHGVSHGRLEITIDNENYVYRWHPDPKHKAVSKPAYDPLNDDEDEEL